MHGIEIGEVAADQALEHVILRRLHCFLAQGVHRDAAEKLRRGAPQHQPQREQGQRHQHAGEMALEDILDHLGEQQRQQPGRRRIKQHGKDRGRQQAPLAPDIIAQQAADDRAATQFFWAPLSGWTGKVGNGIGGGKRHAAPV